MIENLKKKVTGTSISFNMFNFSVSLHELNKIYLHVFKTIPYYNNTSIKNFKQIYA